MGTCNEVGTYLGYHQAICQDSLLNPSPKLCSSYVPGWRKAAHIGNQQFAALAVLAHNTGRNTGRASSVVNILISGCPEIIFSPEDKPPKYTAGHNLQEPETASTPWPRRRYVQSHPVRWLNIKPRAETRPSHRAI